VNRPARKKVEVTQNFHSEQWTVGGITCTILSSSNGRAANESTVSLGGASAKVLIPVLPQIVHLFQAIVY